MKVSRVSEMRAMDRKAIEEFGIPEAMWVIEVKDFRATVTMDSHGNSLHQQIREQSVAAAESLLQS